MPRIFQVDVTVEHGQLRESLASETDRLEMINRLEAILNGTTGTAALRAGVIQILMEQLRNNNAHEPLIIRTRNEPALGDDEERIVWVCDHDDVEVEIDRYPTTPKSGREKNPFKFSKGKKSKKVESTEYKDKDDARLQMFYKFELKGKDKLGNDLNLDPCIICER
jgi:hypothetical protein